MQRRGTRNSVYAFINRVHESSPEPVWLKHCAPRNLVLTVLFRDDRTSATGRDFGHRSGTSSCLNAGEEAERVQKRRMSRGTDQMDQSGRHGRKCGVPRGIVNKQVAGTSCACAWRYKHGHRFVCDFGSDGGRCERQKHCFGWRVCEVLMKMWKKKKASQILISFLGCAGFDFSRSRAVRTARNCPYEAAAPGIFR